MKRRSDIDGFEFRRFWNGPELDALIQRLTAILKPLRSKRTLVLAIEENQEMMRERGGAEPFDGVMEMWFESGREFHRLSADAEYQALMEEMRSLQSRFVDFSQSTRFFTEWQD
jgi:hypothetical protein